MKHKHKFQLLGYGKKILQVSNWKQIMIDDLKALFICECGKTKEVKLK